MNIGEKIKELRKKNDLTQEKLADFLGISYQSISKWECGVTLPDLSMIPALTKLLHVSADELLGLNTEARDERKTYFERKYEDFWKRMDPDADLALAEQAAAEYPDDLRFFHWLASEEFHAAYDEDPKNGGFKTRYEEMLEKSLRHFQLVYENSGDQELKNRALHGIVLVLTGLDRYDEARILAEQFPEPDSFSRNDLLELCLKGDDLLRHRQKTVHDGVVGLIRALNKLWHLEPIDGRAIAARELEYTLLTTLIPDGNYLFYNIHLFFIHAKRAEQAIEEGDATLCVSELAEAKKHAAAFDRAEKSGPQRFTAPLLDRFDYDWGDPNDCTAMEYWRSIAEEKRYDVIRDTPEFQALIQE